MSLPNARMAYEDCFDAFDAALNDPKGVRIRVADPSAAKAFQARLHYARVLDRRHSKQLYEKGAPQYDISQYDTLVATIRSTENGTYVYIEPRSIEQSAIEPLSAVPEEEPPTPESRTLDEIVDDFAPVRRKI